MEFKKIDEQKTSSKLFLKRKIAEAKINRSNKFEIDINQANEIIKALN
jgi:hypothetical protein